jgi:AraC-like DNA-binding protein
MIHFSDEPLEVKYSEYISSKLDYDYAYLSNLFSEVTGSTLQQFIIVHKIERAKELIIYNELSIKEISYKLHYSSVPHFSNQFKKVTGLSPIFFKSLKKRKRTSLENVLVAKPITEIV